MPDNRPAIPRQLARDLLVEAGHRCAIPTCRATTLELAHITPWAKTRAHDFDNMIALCPNCHTRFDKGEIDRLSMLQYKAVLGSGGARERTISAYRTLQETLDRWSEAIAILAHTHVASSPDFHYILQARSACEQQAGLAHAAAADLKSVGDDTIELLTDFIYDWFVHWASSTVDMEWPDYSQSKEERKGEFQTLHEALLELHLAVADDLGLEFSELPLREEDSPSPQPRPLGTLAYQHRRDAADRIDGIHIH
ncbi:HNH endonuclease signature motif containing protein [Streptomyces beijiangensis]|uniref:HNH endonuclease n=1 Tax=Streptomyces beijiangensis TaxID=163361 RepID=A0A939JIQ4_9ACTN|nr:HNH endonuclease signature motif containing protein [Streptomyces beijiangensis]MBO0515763.1 HNH endonuclease [Streptomyces beijiangensis]